jgi:hypothetical protein
LGSNWTSPSFFVGGAPVISGNLWSGSGTAYWSQMKFGPDALVQIQLTDNTTNLYLGLRLSNDQQSGYIFNWDHSSFTARIYRYDSGTLISLNSMTYSPIGAPGAGDIFSFSVIGGLLTVLLNGTPMLYANDSIYINEGWVGVGSS